MRPFFRKMPVASKRGHAHRASHEHVATSPHFEGHNPSTGSGRDQACAASFLVGTGLLCSPAESSRSAASAPTARNCERISKSSISPAKNLSRIAKNSSGQASWRDSLTSGAAERGLPAASASPSGGRGRSHAVPLSALASSRAPSDDAVEASLSWTRSTRPPPCDAGRASSSR